MITRLDSSDELIIYNQIPRAQLNQANDQTLENQRVSLRKFAATDAYHRRFASLRHNFAAAYARRS